MKAIRNPVIWVMSVLAGAQLLTASTAFLDVVPARWAALASVCIVAAQVAVQFWVRGQVTPISDPRDSQGREMVAVNRRIE